MSITLPGQYGLVLLKSARSDAFVEQFRIGRRFAEHDHDFVQDEQLWAVSCAGTPEELQQVLLLLDLRGLARGRDYVVTRFGAGVLDPLPDWLEDVTPGFDAMLRANGFSTATWGKFDTQSQHTWLARWSREQGRFAYREG